MKKYHFVYITTNLINGKQYVGDHSTDDLNCHRTKNYLGSGKFTLHLAIQKYGKENFSREILEFFHTKQEAFDAQEKYIKEYNTRTPNGYNISYKGGSEMSGGSVSEKTRKKMSDAKKGIKFTTEHIKKLSESHIGNKHSQEIINIIALKNKGQKRSKEAIKKMQKPKTEAHKKNIKKGMKGKKYTEERKNNIRVALKESWKDPKKRKKQSEKLKSLNLNPSKETREKISKALKGKIQQKIKCPYCKKEGGIAAMYRWHFNSCKFY